MLSVKHVTLSYQYGIQSPILVQLTWPQLFIRLILRRYEFKADKTLLTKIPSGKFDQKLRPLPWNESTWHWRCHREVTRTLDQCSGIFSKAKNNKTTGMKKSPTSSRISSEEKIERQQQTINAALKHKIRDELGAHFEDSRVHLKRLDSQQHGFRNYRRYSSQTGDHFLQSMEKEA